MLVWRRHDDGAHNAIISSHVQWRWHKLLRAPAAAAGPAAMAPVSVVPAAACCGGAGRTRPLGAQSAAAEGIFTCCNRARGHQVRASRYSQGCCSVGTRRKGVVSVLTTYRGAIDASDRPRFARNQRALRQEPQRVPSAHRHDDVWQCKRGPEVGFGYWTHWLRVSSCDAMLFLILRGCILGRKQVVQVACVVEAGSPVATADAGAAAAGTAAGMLVAISHSRNRNRTGPNHAELSAIRNAV